MEIIWDLPLFVVLELGELEYHMQARVPHVSIPPWHAGVEKGEFNIALKLEYCLNSTRAHEARVPLGFQQHLKHTNFQTLDLTLSLPIT